ncbi:nuclear transport factor 2 family protein [Natrinema amylolyticum]|uniref:nuclear transport factor 2 family protein n=1 Tax=Natrinema amylolyticum TaxID=2878679 RepID=UPI001CFABC22|nr:nuclear transport factor 2 family protein [Natrinema amylolyticum]
MATTEKTNVEIVKELYEAFNQGDLETCLAGFADDITWTEPEGSPLASGTYTGTDDVMENVFAPLDDQFERFEVVVDRFIDGEDTIVMEGKHRTTPIDGDTFEVPGVHVMDMEDGRVKEFTGYEDTALTQQLMDA